MRIVVRVLAQTLAIVLLLGTSVGQAQTASPKARARELYTQGQQLFRQGDFVAAQRAFEEAYRAVPNPVVLLSVAECQVRAEDYAGALTSLRQYLAEKPNAPDRAQVEAQIANLEAKPGFVAIESAPPGAMIWVNGENTGYITPNELSLRAGRHTIALTSPGYLQVEQPVDVAIGSRQRLSLTLSPEPPPAVAEEAPVPPPVEEPSYGARHASPAVWAATAVAGVTLITGGALGVAALMKVSDYNKKADAYKHTGNEADRSAAKKIADKGDKLALVADVNFGIAAVAAITALVIYATSAEPVESTPPQAFRIAPQLTLNQVGLTGQMRF